MFNLQRDVLAANIASPFENEAVKEARLEQLAALKESFVQHRDAMINKINLAEQFAPTYLEEKDSNETYGDLEHPSYLETLDRLRTRYLNMRLWNPVQSLLEIPSPMPTYIEKYGSKSAGLGNFHDFWSQVWCLPGYAESFYSDFKDAIYLPAALEYGTHPECAKHMQTIFQLAAHYACTTASSPPLVFFDTMRALIAGRSPRLRFRDIPVRDPDNDEEGPAVRKSKRRKLKN